MEADTVYNGASEEVVILLLCSGSGTEDEQHVEGRVEVTHTVSPIHGPA